MISSFFLCHTLGATTNYQIVGQEATRLRNVRPRPDPGSGHGTDPGSDPGSSHGSGHGSGHGSELIDQPSFVYFVFNKPPGCMTERTGAEERGAKGGGAASVYDALPPGMPHVPHVGRLDKDTVRGC